MHQLLYPSLHSPPSLSPALLFLLLLLLLQGLVCASRSNLQHHKQPFAHDVPSCPDLLSAIKALKPTALVGVSTISKAFNRQVVEAMCELNERPIIFPLSNPTSKSECSFEEAFRWVGFCEWRGRGVGVCVGGGVKGGFWGGGGGT
jgi:hypothetical protein